MIRGTSALITVTFGQNVFRGRARDHLVEIHRRKHIRNRDRPTDFKAKFYIFGDFPTLCYCRAVSLSLGFSMASFTTYRLKY